MNGLGMVNGRDKHDLNSEHQYRYFLFSLGDGNYQHVYTFYISSLYSSCCAEILACYHSLSLLCNFSMLCSCLFTSSYSLQVVSIQDICGLYTIYKDLKVIWICNLQVNKIIYFLFVFRYTIEWLICFHVWQLRTWH